MSDMNGQINQGMTLPVTGEVKVVARESVRPEQVGDFDFGETNRIFPDAKVSVKVGSKVVEILLSAYLYREPFTVAGCSVWQDGGLAEAVLAFLDKDVDFSEILQSYFEAVVKKQAEQRAVQVVKKTAFYDARETILQAEIAKVTRLLIKGMTVKISSTKEQFLKDDSYELGMDIAYRGKEFHVKVSAEGGLYTHDLQYHDRSYKHLKSLVSKIIEWMDEYWRGQDVKKQRAEKIAVDEKELTAIVGIPVHCEAEKTSMFLARFPDKDYGYLRFGYSSSSDPRPFTIHSTKLTQSEFVSIVNILMIARKAQP